MFIQSVRFKIILWYMLILTIALLVFSLVLYQNFSHKASEGINDLLRSRAKGIEYSIDTYWETERLEANQSAKRERFVKQDNINFVKIAQRWVDDKNTDPGLVNFIVRILDGKGNLIASSKNVSLKGLTSNIFHSLENGKEHFEDIHIDVNSSKPISLRVFTTPVIENNKVAYIVQIGTPLGAMHSDLNNLRLLLLILLPSTVLVTGLSGAFLAKLALKPVHDMIDTIHQITAENLKLRINIPHTKDEINSLALTFNEMIGRLDEAFTSQRQFMEDISHELKTPLSILKGELEVTLKRIRSAKEYEDTLQSSLQEVNRINRIVESLLILARFDTKTVVIEKLPVNLGDLIRDIIEDVRVLAEQKSIAVTFKDAQGYSMLGDKAQLKRLFLNLLDNAIKYTPHQGQVSVDVRVERNDLQVEVADSGVGISPKEATHIFNRFYRIDKSRASAGFGLGLSIAQSIARAHGGDIKVRSNIPQGSVFCVTLPVLK
ncbi:MAG: HAMP domain-containing protein [Candidatus Omnitrophica bacterium]|nr:HAMP domain-containing protein [Candidatus Omnitrophota bacterium]